MQGRQYVVITSTPASGSRTLGSGLANISKVSMIGAPPGRGVCFFFRKYTGGSCRSSVPADLFAEHRFTAALSGPEQTDNFRRPATAIDAILPQARQATFPDITRGSEISFHHFLSSLIQPPVTLNVTTSVKSCSTLSIFCIDPCCCVSLFHIFLSIVPTTR